MVPDDVWDAVSWVHYPTTSQWHERWLWRSDPRSASIIRRHGVYDAYLRDEIVEDSSPGHSRQYTHRECKTLQEAQEWCQSEALIEKMIEALP